MGSTNLKQALRPDDGEPLPNTMGTAPGLYWDVAPHVARLGWKPTAEPCWIMAFPGVPREMRTIWQEEALPRLANLLPPKQTVLISRSLKFVGVGESMLAEKLQDLMAQSEPTVSPYVGQAEVRIRIAVKASSTQEGLSRIAPVEAEILRRVGADHCYGADEETLEDIVGRTMVQHGWTLAVAESCTGGLLSSRLTDVAGSSRYITLNMVTYSNEAKIAQLGVSPGTLAAHGAVSAEVATEMAEGIRRVAKAHVGVAITGIAGPEGGTPQKPAGLAYMGFSRQDAPTLVKRVSVNPRYDRTHIKYWFSHLALNQLRLYLLS
jgi:nicotinamide-nucleotide amidase